MNAPLYNKILQYANASPARFHTPGHKGRLGGIFEQFANYDVTELSATDNIFFPKNALLEAERLASALFGVKMTLFCAGGATLGNQTALSFFAGKKVIFDRNIHVSAFNAAMLLDIKPVFVYNSINGATGSSLPVTAEQTDTALRENPDASAVFITSPDYYGFCADCAKLKAVCEKRGITLIIDNSHGAHMRFTGNSAHCADIIIDSAHKTLPVLTGGAYIHFNNEITREKAAANMLAFGSTSPSFPILASLDFARAWCDENKELFISLSERVSSLKKRLSDIGYTVADAPLYDPLRLCITAKNADSINQTLERRGIFAEMCDGRNTVFLFSPFNNDGDFSRLENALTENIPEPADNHKTDGIPCSEFVCAAKSAFFADSHSEATVDSIGKTAAKPFIPYPPGVPVLLPGERITKELAGYLIGRGADTVEVTD